jgi:hypothetical protein
MFNEVLFYKLVNHVPPLSAPDGKAVMSLSQTDPSLPFQKFRSNRRKPEKVT